jgi:hypothetical protein
MTRQRIIREHTSSSQAMGTTPTMDSSSTTKKDSNPTQKANSPNTTHRLMRTELNYRLPSPQRNI